MTLSASCVSVFLVAILAAASGTAEKVPNDAPEIRIEVFSDFQCPFCAQFAQPIRKLQAEGVQGVRTTVEFRNFPLFEIHSDAQLAHQAAMAAREQGKFWEMHDLLFGNRLSLKRDHLLSYAKKLGLDMDRFQSDLDSERIKQLIKTDRAEGVKRRVEGTPTFFVNGRQYTGTNTFDQLKELVLNEGHRLWAMSEIADGVMAKGPVDAPVTVEFFADLQSPLSGVALSVLDELLARYPSVVRLQFRNFPLKFHPLAGLAHEAAMDAAKQNHFWDFATYILDHQNSLSEQELVEYAGRLGLDEMKFAEMIQQRRYAARVDADVAEGARRGVRGSPVIFVNGKRIDGVPSSKMLTDYVEAEFARKPSEKVSTR